MSTLTAPLAGGLGNQLFQLAALVHIARITQRKAYLRTLENPSPHSTTDYFSTIFKHFRHLYIHFPIQFEQRVIEPSYIYHDWSSRLRFIQSPELHGYFQNWQYVDPEFVKRLSLPTDVLTRYTGIHEGIFLHIRGGDYVDHPDHDLHLDAYYERAIALFPDAHFFIVTNDVDYALKRPFLNGLQYTLVLQPELDTLYLMSQCAGGICANSSFSWWGAYLNPNRKIVMPNRWFPNHMKAIYIEGFYFPGVIKCQV